MNNDQFNNIISAEDTISSPSMRKAWKILWNVFNIWWFVRLCVFVHIFWEVSYVDIAMATFVFPCIVLPLMYGIVARGKYAYHVWSMERQVRRFNKELEQVRLF